MKFDLISETSPLLDEVQAIWRAHSQWLGFFPDGAFKDYAYRRQILVAISDEQTAVGYVAYRPSPGKKISVVHLCIDQKYRNRGIANKLISELADKTSSYRGMGLWCRNDFPASKAWPHLGFVARKEKAGKSKEGHPLTFWWHDYQTEDLLTLANREPEVSLSAVIDANVFFDLYEKSNVESEGLRADWLLDEIRLLVSPELYNEINRDANIKRREESRRYAEKFEEVSPKKQEVDGAYILLEKLFLPSSREQDRSDLRQLAWAVAGNAKAFITRDANLLAKHDEVYALTGVSVVRPSELIVQIDSLVREGQYQRDRLAGTTLHYGRDQKHDEDELAVQFQNVEGKEKKSDFLKVMHALKADPEHSFCITVRDDENKPLGILGYTHIEPGMAEVLLARGCKGLLAASIVRYLLAKALLNGLEHIDICVISDAFFNEEISKQLPSLGFIRASNAWVKVILRGSYSTQEVTDKLITLSSKYPVYSTVFESLQYDLSLAIAKSDQTILSEIEQMLWPVEITDLDIPAFIVSIKPGFAQHLFDEEIASLDFFGANVNLALNQEAAYYRSPRNSAGLRAPARLLWYVSSDKRKRIFQAGALRAGSRLEEVVVAPAKDIFKQFRRFGVFGRNEVIKTAGGSPSGDVMALRFSGTLPLEVPIPWDALQKNLRDENIRTTLVSPTRISSDLYFRLRYPKQ